MKHRKRLLAAARLLAFSAAALSLAGSAAQSHALVATPAATSPDSIIPGVPWFDSHGHLIQGHNGSVIHVGSAFYWIGQDLTNGRADAACYQSTDLVHWTKDGDVVSVADLTRTWSPRSPSIYYLIGSTQVMYDSVARQYVLWVSVNIKGLHPIPRPSSDFLVDVAETSGTKPTPCSAYRWHRATLWRPFGHPVGDIGLFTHTVARTTYSYLTDADQGELPCKPRDKNCYKPNANGTPNTSKRCVKGSKHCITGPELRIFLIRPDGRGVTDGDTSVEGTVQQLYGFFEAPAMFKAGGVYFLLASHKTSWVPNANQYNFTTKAPPTAINRKNWTGWQSSWRDVVPADKKSSTITYTCDSQTFFVLPVRGSAATTYIYLGDRWDTSHLVNGSGDSLGDSSYVWLPLRVSTAPKPSLRLNCTIHNWSIHTATGVARTLADPTFTFTNVGSSLVIEGPTANGNLVQAASNGQRDQEWKIINVPYSTPGPSYTPWYKIQNVGSGQVIDYPCCAAGFGNPLKQDRFKGAKTQLWQFVSVNGGPSLTLKSIADGNLVDAAKNGTLVQDPSANPPATSQQWALTKASG